MNAKNYDSLEKIDADIAVCEDCPLHETRAKTVPGAGSPQARLMFIGEGPGAKEDELGLPFIGRSGKLLTQLIEEMGLTRDEVFITSLVKCRPPHNRNPSKAEITACRTFLQAQFDAISPKIICTLGLPATQTLLGTKEGIGKLRGKWFDYKGITLMPTFHPAYLLRSRSKITEARQDFQEIMRVYREVA